MVALLDTRIHSGSGTAFVCSSLPGHWFTHDFRYHLHLLLKMDADVIS